MLRELIRDTGSIAVTAQRNDISYNHAWTLLRLMNASFRLPLVSTTHGGKSKGGATLTEAGEQVVEIYRLMIARCKQATLNSRSHLRKLLCSAKPPSPPSTTSLNDE